MPTAEQANWLAKLGVTGAPGNANRDPAARSGTGEASSSAGAKSDMSLAARPALVPSGMGAMRPDCKIVRGKVRGPKHHVLCATHHHVVDEAARIIIAKDLEDYTRRFGKPQSGTETSTAVPAPPTPAKHDGVKPTAPVPSEKDKPATGIAGLAAVAKGLLPNLKVKYKYKIASRKIPVLKGRVEIEAEGELEFSCVVVRNSDSPVALTIGEDGFKEKIAAEVWESNAKLELGGVDLLSNPKIAAEAEANKKDGVILKVELSAETPIGTAAVSMIGWQYSPAKGTAKIGTAEGKLEGKVVHLEHVPVIDGFAIHDLEFKVTLTFSIEPKYAAIICDLLKDAAENACRQVAARAAAMATGTADAAASAVEMLGGLGAGMLAGAILAEVAMVAAFAKEIADQAEIDATAEAINVVRGEIKTSFEAALHGNPNSTDGAAKVAADRGYEIYKKIFAEVRKEMPEASDDDIRSGLSQMDFKKGKAPEAIGKFVDELALPFQRSAWRRWVDNNHGFFVTPSLAREAFIACFRTMPNDNDPEWQRWAKR